MASYVQAGGKVLDGHWFEYFNGESLRSLTLPPTRACRDCGITFADRDAEGCSERSERLRDARTAALVRAARKVSAAVFSSNANDWIAAVDELNAALQPFEDAAPKGGGSNEP